MTGAEGRDDASRPSNDPASDENDGSADDGAEDGADEVLPFGQDPQEQQGDDPGSGGS